MLTVLAGLAGLIGRMGLMSFYHQYDSDVADEDASNSDYGVNTSIGYEF